LFELLEEGIFVEVWIPSTGATHPDFDEDAFLKQLEQDMANMMGGGGAGSKLRLRNRPPRPSRRRGAV
jgi:hypothetical protein